MTLTTTFIPTQQTKDLLCALWAEYGCWGLGTRDLLISLRGCLGKDEFGRFQEDMVRLMKRYTAKFAVGLIIKAAIQRSNVPLPITRLRGVYDPAHHNRG